MKPKSTVSIVSANWTRFANAVLLAGSVICNSAFLYFFYNYGWTRHWQFSSNVMGPLTRYALPVFLGVAFGAALFLQPLRRINLALSVLALTIPIYCLSLLLMLDLQFPGQNVDRRTNLEVVADLRKANIRAFGPLSPIVLLNRQPDGSFKSGISDGGLEVLSLAGISSATTVQCNESGQYSIYENDEHGFNNSRGIWGILPIEIVAVGDSYTQGSCVPPGKGFIAVIQKVYPER